MKYFIPILLILLSGCQNFMMMEPSYPDIPDGIYDIKTAFEWTANNIRYVSDMEVHGREEYWQCANETDKLRTGDCEDLSIRFAVICKQLGHKAEIRTANAHCIALIDGVQYDCMPIKTKTGYIPVSFQKDYSIYINPKDYDIDEVLHICSEKYGSY